MYTPYKNFIRGVSINHAGKIGVIIATSSFLSFIIFEIAQLFGFQTNAYVGLITYLLFPSLFLVGLLLIPLAGIFTKRIKVNPPGNCWRSILIFRTCNRGFSGRGCYELFQH